MSISRSHGNCLSVPSRCDVPGLPSAVQAGYERNRQLLRTHLPVLQACTELNEELIKQMRDAGVTAAMAEGLTKAEAEKKVQLGSGLIHDAAYLPPSRMMVILGLVHTLHLYMACRKPCKADILAEAPIDVLYIDQFADKVCSMAGSLLQPCRSINMQEYKF